MVEGCEDHFWADRSIGVAVGDGKARRTMCRKTHQWLAGWISVNEAVEAIRRGEWLDEGFVLRFLILVSFLYAFG